MSATPGGNNRTVRFMSIRMSQQKITVRSMMRGIAVGVALAALLGFVAPASAASRGAGRNESSKLGYI